MHKWRKSRAATFLCQLVRETTKILIAQRRIYRVVWKFGLYQDITGYIPASSTARHLGQESVQSFRRAKIGAVEQAVGVNHAHQIQVREIMTLGEYLRADQYVDLALRDTSAHCRP